MKSTGGGNAGDEPQTEALSFAPEALEGAGGDAALAKKVRELDRKLKEALRQEEYEQAAHYRDEIKALKAADAGEGAKSHE